MNRSYKILYVCDFYSYGTGGSSPIPGFFTKLPFVSRESKLFVGRIINKHPNESINNRIEEADGKKVIEEFLSGGYDLIQWIKSSSNRLYRDFIKEMKQRDMLLPIITYVVQKPSFRGNPLLNDEIRYSSKIVVIDKSSYNDSRFLYIPRNRLDWVYCNFSTKEDIERFDKIYEGVEKSKSDKVVIGRASTPEKCPKDMFERVFDKIRSPKKFVIVGVPEGSWIDKKIEKRMGDYEVERYGQLPYEDYIRKMVDFDIFLYYLPMDCHSSIDGTLGAAMLMRKPVVYYGPSAPAERFHDANALVANTPDELAALCDRLASDPILRQQIGEKGRQTTIDDFSLEVTRQKFERIYSDVVSNNLHRPYRIPLRYYFFNNIFFFYKKCEPYLKSILKLDFSLVKERIRIINIG